MVITMCLSASMFIMADAKRVEDTKAVTEVKAIVLSVDDSEILSSGFSNIGYQSVEVRILEGEFEGRVVEASNTLLGANDLDEIYKPGDRIVLAIQTSGGDISGVKTISTLE